LGLLAVLEITHKARHTFATTIALTKGVPIETVSKMLGYTSVKTTQIYAKVINSKIGSDMDMLAEKLSGMESKFATH
jgi:site-specific recombinase XerD